jgi:uncharacterized membrane protein YcaP (DUF421 family)
MDIISIFLLIGKTIFSYIFLMIILKIMGKRELSQISMFDVVIFLIMSELFSLALNDKESSLIQFIVPILVIVILELLSAFLSLKSYRIRRFFEGEPTFLIYNGEIDYVAMKKNNYNISNLMIQLRNNNVQSPIEVSFAILEGNGNLNIIKKEEQIVYYPDPIIMDGKLNLIALKKMNLSEEDVLLMIAKNNYQNYDEIFFAQLLVDGIYIVPFKSVNNS